MNGVLALIFAMTDFYGGNVNVMGNADMTIRRND
jgi:hypothetical protein